MLDLLLREAFWVKSGLLMLGLASFFYVFQFMWPKPIVRRIATLSLIISIISFVLTLVFRSITAQYFALSNMYEALIVITIAMTTAYVIFEHWFKAYALGWAVCLIGLVMIFYAGSLPTEINPLVPALQSYWRMIHVPPMMFSYAFFTLSFLSAVAYLFTSKGQNDPNLLGREAYAASAASTDGDALGNPTATMSKVDLYDEVCYRAIAAGFPFLLIGVILGAVWANEAWGNYWSWDPKESASLMTLLGYGAYLHMRINGGHSKRTLAWVAVGGFVLVLLTFVGVNIWGFGSMHSYGSVK